jgi:hypothetical protein
MILDEACQQMAEEARPLTGYVLTREQMNQLVKEVTTGVDRQEDIENIKALELFFQANGGVSCLVVVGK